jgi:DNA-binding NtrC family response regulator
MKNLKIFAIDDDVFYLGILEQNLRIAGFKNLWFFHHPSEAFRSIDKNPDIILLDYRLGSENGVDVLNQFKSQYPGIYVVMLSSYFDKQVVKEALESGAFDYLVKGQNEMEVIEATIKRIHDNGELFKKEQKE